MSIDSLDDALVRPGRLHYHIHLDYPSTQDLQHIVALKLRDIPVARDVTAQTVTTCMIESISNKSITGADINGFCRRAVENALRDNIAQQKASLSLLPPRQQLLLLHSTAPDGGSTLLNDNKDGKDGNDNKDGKDGGDDESKIEYSSSSHDNDIIDTMIIQSVSLDNFRAAIIKC